MKIPSVGKGGYGISSEFGDLTGMTFKEVDTFLRLLGAMAIVSSTEAYITYKFSDKSSITIRISDGRVSRLPKPSYDNNGRNINKGLRLNRDGSLLRTRDQFGNPILNTHDTGEFVIC